MIDELQTESSPETRGGPSEGAIRLRRQEMWALEGHPDVKAPDRWLHANAELEVETARTSTSRRTDLDSRTVEPVWLAAARAGVMMLKTALSMLRARGSHVPREERHVAGESDPRVTLEEEINVSREDGDAIPAGRYSSTLRPATHRYSLAPSIISADLALRGIMEATGYIHLDGCVEGVICAAEIVVCETAVIQGKVIADDVTIHGHVRGTIHARKLLLCTHSRVEGDVLYEVLAVEHGARLEANFRHTKNTHALDVTCEAEITENMVVSGAPLEKNRLSQTAA